MTNPENEVWKEYPVDFELDNFFKIEFSSNGAVRTYNSLHPEGAIVKTPLQNGFPIYRTKLFRPRTNKEIDKIAEIQSEIDEISFLIKRLGTTEKDIAEKKALRAERDEIIQKRKSLNLKINKERTINFAVLVHKAVAELFLEKPTAKSKTFIIHKDFDKEHNAANNLAWASREELNERTMKHPKLVVHYFKLKFIENKANVGFSKLTENQVLTIKKRLKKGDTLRKLAKRFNVSDMQIHRIKTGENWSHVKLVEDLIEEKK